HHGVSSSPEGIERRLELDGSSTDSLPVNAVDVLARIDTQVDDETRGAVTRHTTPPARERRAVDVSVEVRDVGREAPVVPGPLGKCRLELDTEIREEASRSRDIVDDDADRTEARRRHAEHIARSRRRSR